MLNFKELWKGKHISVVSPEEYQYEAVHEPDVITVLPIIEVHSKHVKGIVDYYLVIRKEVCPPYLIKYDGLEPFFYTPITGRRDKSNETPEETMRRELVEEAGIELIDYEILIHKKKMPVCKTSDMRMDFFILLVREFNPVEAVGDGTVTEEMSKSIFVKLGDLYKIIENPNVDYLLYGAYNILMNELPKHLRV